MSNEIQLYEKCQDPVAGILKLGEALGRSAILGFTKSEQGIVLAWECFATRQAPLQVVRRIHITERGQILMRSDAMLAGYRALGGKVRWLAHGPEKVEGEWEFEGNKTVVGCDIEWARKAGYVRPKSAWESNPEAMLQAACIRKAVRMLAPEVIVESGDPDGEMQQQSEPKTIQLAPTPEAKSEPVTIEVRAEKVSEPVSDVDEKAADEKAESLMGLAPAKRAEPVIESTVTPKQESASLTTFCPDGGFPLNRRTDRKGQHVDADTLAKLETAFGDVAAGALAFLRSDQTPEKGAWIGPVEGFEHLSMQEGKRMLNAVPQFKARLKQKGFTQ